MAVEHPHLDHRAGHAGRQAKGGVANVGRLFTEDGPQQLLFRGHRALALGRDLAHQDVARQDLGADRHDASLVEVAQGLLADVGDVAGDFFRAQLGVAGHDLELLDVDRGEHVIAHDALGDQDRVFEVVAVPGHERDEHVAAQGQLAQLRGRTVGDHVAGVDLVSHTHQRALVDAGVLVGALELGQAVDVDAGLGRVAFFRRADDDAGAVDLLDHAGAAGHHGGAGVAGHHVFHAGAHERGVRLDQRHGLALHVRAHQGAIGVIVFQEGDQGRGHRHHLLGRHIHEVDLVLAGQGHFAVDPHGDEVFDHLAVLQHDVGLGDGVLGLFHRRHVDHVFGDLAVLHAPVRALDEAVLVHPRVGGERVDQADVRAFRGFDRADPAVVGRVHVADFEARALAGQTAGAERRKAALVGDLRQRIGLVHELRKLGRAEELAHRRRRRLGVDQVVRHDRVDVDRGHAFLDRPLHAQQADTVLVFEELTDRTDPAVAEVVDVVDFAAAVAQAHQGLQDRYHVVLAQDADVVRAILLQAHVHLDAAHGGQVVALGVEEQAREHRFRGFHRRRLAGTHDAVDVEQGVVAAVVLVHPHRVAHVGAHRDVVDVQHVDGLEALVGQGLDGGGVKLVAGFGVDLAGRGVDFISRQIAPDQGVRRQQQGLGAAVGELLGGAGRDLMAGGRDLLARVGVDQGEVRLHAAPALGLVGGGPAARATLVGHDFIEGGEDLFPIHAEAIEEGRGRQLAAPVDAYIDDVLGVELEVEPGAAVGDHPRGEQQLARGVRLALVVVEEDARRTVHLGDDHPLGAVDDEGALVGHERNVAHVDVLLLDVLDRAGAGFFVRLEHDQAQLDLQRRRVGHVALDAFLDVVLRLLKLIGDVLEHGALVEVLDREDGLEDRLDALVLALARPDFALEELLVG